MRYFRLPRFSQSPSLAGMQLTESDREVIRGVHRYRFMRSSLIGKLVGRNSANLLRRLQLLFHHGFLERPRIQLDYYHKGGSREIIYGLGNKGALLLKLERGKDCEHIRWNEKNREIGRIFFEHALLVSDIMVALELAFRKTSNVRLLQGSNLPIRAKGGCQSAIVRWNLKLTNGIKVGVVPDWVFAISATDVCGIENRRFLFLEADRGTMPVVRKNLRQSSFYRKLLAYEATWAQGLHRSKFGCNRFYVLTVTKSPARVKSLVEACSKLKSGHGLFLFSDEASVKAHGDILTMKWQTGRPGETATLLD